MWDSQLAIAASKGRLEEATGKGESTAAAVGEAAAEAAAKRADVAASGSSSWALSRNLFHSDPTGLYATIPLASELRRVPSCLTPFCFLCFGGIHTCTRQHGISAAQFMVALGRITGRDYQGGQQSSMSRAHNGIFTCLTHQLLQSQSLLRQSAGTAPCTKPRSSRV